MTDDLDDALASSQKYGEKRVKTKELDVEQFSPEEIVKARNFERSRRAARHLHDFNFSIVSPNKEKFGGLD